MNQVSVYQFLLALLFTFSLGKPEKFTDTTTVGDRLTFAHGKPKQFTDTTTVWDRLSLTTPRSLEVDGTSLSTTYIPSSLPSSLPSAVPSSLPSSLPSVIPSSLPSAVPSLLPSLLPSVIPSSLPSVVPSSLPSSLPYTGLCTTDEKFEKTDDDLGRYTCARIALEKAAIGGIFDCNGFFQDFREPCPIECNECPACADSFEKITGFKDDQKTCQMISGKKKKKIKKYCRKNKNVLEACPLTCDNCYSNAPTDSYVCEDTSFQFTYAAANDPTTVPFTCASLDKRYNAGTIDDACTNPEIKVECPVLCDNCNSASPSVVSSAPSSKPSVSSTTCVDKKVKGIKISYTRGKVFNGVFKGETFRENKKCKQLAKEPKETIVNACQIGEDTNGMPISDYCKLTCDNCGISAAPSTTVIEPECDDNDVNTWKYEGDTVTCTDLRGMDELTQADICKKKNGAKTNCISTCNLCPE